TLTSIAGNEMHSPVESRVPSPDTPEILLGIIARVPCQTAHPWSYNADDNAAYLRDRSSKNDTKPHNFNT
ncbi:hypothetical protein M404DRAFT_994942, partial [Pisolithus tinctorius Marx 270]